MAHGQIYLVLARQHQRKSFLMGNVCLNMIKRKFFATSIFYYQYYFDTSLFPLPFFCYQFFLLPDFFATSFFFYQFFFATSFFATRFFCYQLFWYQTFLLPAFFVTRFFFATILITEGHCRVYMSRVIVNIDEQKHQDFQQTCLHFGGLCFKILLTDWAEPIFKRWPMAKSILS